MPSESPLSLIVRKIKTTNRRALFGILCYLVLLGIALYVLLPVRTSEERYLLGFVLFVFTVLIFRTLLHAAKGDLD